MSLVGEWMETHAVDQHLAARIGLYKRHEDTLCVPVKRADGSTFVRTRRFPGDWMQPAGEPLALWWPLGRSSGGSVLVTEGEGDALAAASILDKTDHPTLNGLGLCSLPGLGAVKVAAAELSAAKVRHAYICFDNDPSKIKDGKEVGHQGQNATAKLGELLYEEGIVPFPIRLSLKDLADHLQRFKLKESRESFLADLIADTPPRTFFPRKAPRPRSAPLTASESTLKDIPAPHYVAALLETEEPRVNQLIRCPFHDDKTPSMRVGQHLFHCYGCGVGGDIYTFQMELHGEDFPTAKANLLQRFDGAGSTPSQTTPLSIR